MEHISAITARVMAEIAKKALDAKEGELKIKKIWKQVAEEFNMPSNSRVVQQRGSLIRSRNPKMAKRFEELKKEAGLE